MTRRSAETGSRRADARCTASGLALALRGALLASVLCGCSTAPITVRVVSTSDFGIACPQTRMAFFLDAVEDKRGYADSRNIGFTQTGMFNVQTSLLIEPAAASVLKDALSGLLANCGNLAAESGAARFLLKPSLLGLQVTERTGMFSEEISATLKYDALVVDAASGQRVGRSTASGTASVSSGVDTTEYAARVVGEALRESLVEFSRELGRYQ